MKKIILTGCVGIAMLFMGNANAQGFYAELSGGYGWGLGENQLGVESYTDVTLNSSGMPVFGDGSYDRAINGTMGTGLNITVSPGYMITKNLGIEIGINYFKGSETRISENSNPDPDHIDHSKTTAYSNQVRLIPSLVFNTGGDEGFYGFAKLGLLLPITGSTTGNMEGYEYQTDGSLLKSEVETKTEGKFSLGFRGSVGVGYKISDLISVNLEGFYTALHVQAKKRVMESYTVNGTDQIADAKTIQTETVYVDELNGSSNNPSYISNPSDLDVDSPLEEMMAPTNFSQLGFQIGVKFSF